MYMKHVVWVGCVMFFVACGVPKTEGITSVATSVNSYEEALKNELKQYPDSLKLVENLSAYYLSVQNFEAALAQINKAIAKNSSNPQFQNYQSIIYAEKGDTIKAIKSLEKAVDLLPKTAYIISLAALYAQTKNPLALSMADALLGSKAGAQKEAYFIKGLYYSYNNEKEKAISFFDKCTGINYTFMDAHLEKAIALYDLKKFKEATAVLQKAITIQNNYDKGYYYLGRCFEKLNQKVEAVEAYQMALKLDPGYSEAAEALNKLR
jgi:tetratricopeptide (TPR) repeat protein